MLAYRLRISQTCSEPGRGAWMGLWVAVLLPGAEPLLEAPVGGKQQQLHVNPWAGGHLGFELPRSYVESNQPVQYQLGRHVPCTNAGLGSRKQIVEGKPEAGRLGLESKGGGLPLRAPGLDSNGQGRLEMARPACGAHLPRLGRCT